MNKRAAKELADRLDGGRFAHRAALRRHWAGIAPIHAASASDLVLRNVNTGAFEVYDVGAASSGAVGLDWRLGDFAADPPTDDSGNVGHFGGKRQNTRSCVL